MPTHLRSFLDMLRIYNLRWLFQPDSEVDGYEKWSKTWWLLSGENGRPGTIFRSFTPVKRCISCVGVRRFTPFCFRRFSATKVAKRIRHIASGHDNHALSLPEITTIWDYSLPILVLSMVWPHFFQIPPTEPFQAFLANDPTRKDFDLLELFLA